MTKLDRQYQKVLKKILKEGHYDYHQRTKHGTYSLPGITFEIEKGFPLLTLRRVPIRIFVAEQIWILTGSRRVDDFLEEFTKIWHDFSNAAGVVTVAYGYRMRRHFGRDQLKGLVKLLSKDPSSRHGVVIFWDPADDGLANSLTKRAKRNVPCPYTFTVNIIGKKLHFHLVIRSNDMILGFPHDVGGFALMQRILAAKLKVGIGKFTYSVSNAHIYDIHKKAAEELIKRKNNHPEIEIKAEENWFDRGMKGDRKLVHEIIEKLEGQYQPSPPIKGLRIVL